MNENQTRNKPKTRGNQKLTDTKTKNMHPVPRKTLNSRKLRNERINKSRMKKKQAKAQQQKTDGRQKNKVLRKQKNKMT